MKGPTKNQSSSPTGWQRMRVWRMSLRRTKKCHNLRSWLIFIILNFHFSPQLNGKTSVATVSEIQADERKKTIDKAAKQLRDVWMPHANPLRNINTSTKWTEKDFIYDHLCWLQLRHMLYLTLYPIYPNHRRSQHGRFVYRNMIFWYFLIN